MAKARWMTRTSLPLNTALMPRFCDSQNGTAEAT